MQVWELWYLRDVKGITRRDEILNEIVTGANIKQYRATFEMIQTYGVDGG